MNAWPRERCDRRLGRDSMLQQSIGRQSELVLSVNCLRVKVTTVHARSLSATARVLAVDRRSAVLSRGQQVYSSTVRNTLASLLYVFQETQAGSAVCPKDFSFLGVNLLSLKGNRQAGHRKSFNRSGGQCSTAVNSRLFALGSTCVDRYRRWKLCCLVSTTAALRTIDRAAVTIIR